MGFLFGGAPKYTPPPPPSEPSTQEFENELKARQKASLGTLLTGGQGIQNDLLQSKSKLTLKTLLGE